MKKKISWVIVSLWMPWKLFNRFGARTSLSLTFSVRFSLCHSLWAIGQFHVNAVLTPSEF